MMPDVGAERAGAISLCMIVRNEAARLRPCLESARPWVAEMVVVDTGSTDGTPELARSLGARVVHFSWCDDFAAARNAALPHARGAWILWLDADERLDPTTAPRLPRLAVRQRQTDDARPRLYRLLIRHWQHEDRASGEVVSQYSGRLFQRHPQVLWHGLTHERVVHLDGPGALDVVLSDEVVIDHLGHTVAARRGQAKDARNVRLLHLAIKRHPRDGFYRAKLGAHCLEAGDAAGAITHLKAALALSAVHPEEEYRASAYSSLVAAHLAQGEVAAATAAGREGLTAFADYPPLWWQTGVSLLLAGDWDGAAECFQRARTCGDVSHRYPLDRSTITWRPLLGLATVHELRQEWAAARDLLQRAQAEAPRQREVLLALTRVACALKDWSTATTALAQLAANGGAKALDPEIARLQAEVYRGQGHHQEAYDLLDRVLRTHPAALAVRLDLAQLLRAAGEAEAALSVLAPALDESELPAAFYHCLAAVLTDLGRHDDAAAAETLAQQATPPMPAGGE